MKTLYEFATEKMTRSIEKYLELSKTTFGFSALERVDFSDIDSCEMLLGGKSLEVRESTPEYISQSLDRVKSVEFDVEKGVSYFVYKHTRNYILELVAEARKLSLNYTRIGAEDIKASPYLLPIWQAALSISSKSNLKSLFQKSEGG